MLKRIIIYFYSYNYFNGPTKLFLDLYPIKFLNTSAKENIYTERTILLKDLKF